MNHHGAVLLVVGSGVFELEAFGKVVVDLNCSELPAAAYCVLDHEVELRAVEGCLTEFGAGFQSFFGASFDDGLLGKVPVLVGTDVFFLVLGVAK